MWVLHVGFQEIILLEQLLLADVVARAQNGTRADSVELSVLLLLHRPF